MDHKSDNLPHFTLWAFLQQLRLHISRRSVIYLLLPMYPNEVPFMAATCSPVFQQVTYLNLCADVAEFSAVIQPWAMCSKLSLPAMTLWSRDSDLGWQPHSCLILSHRLGPDLSRVLLLRQAVPDEGILGYLNVGPDCSHGLLIPRAVPD